MLKALRGPRGKVGLVVVGALIVAGVVALVNGIGFADARGTGGAQAPVPPRSTRPSIDPALLAGFDPLVHRREGATLVGDLSDGRHAVLTLDPDLQEFVQELYARYHVPYAALVAIEPRTGRVLAYVSHSSANPGAGDLARDPSPPAASVFKVVTGAALIEAGVGPATRVCYHGGHSNIGPSDIVDDPRDSQCATLAEAMGGSINAVFAKLALAHLDRARLGRYAAAFGFGQVLPFDIPLRASPADVPAERLELARAAAGFWHMHMSPVHGALIAATIANDGRMPRAGMVDRVTDRSGATLARFEPATFRAVIGSTSARAVNQMMRRTVTDGTARRTFHDPSGQPFLPGIAVAGKTGTLSGANPYRGYTWWVGFAPADRPTIAVAALVVNTPLWQIKASYAAREALRFYLVEAPAHRTTAARRAAAAAFAPSPLSELGD